MKKLMLFLTLAPVLAAPFALADGPSVADGWRLNEKSSERNPLFSEFKYFNFQDAKISGVMTYSTMAPAFTQTLKLSAYFVESGHVWSLQHTYPLKCVVASSTTIEADFCHEGGIQILAASPTELKLRVRQSTGPVQWDFVMTTPASELAQTITHIPLDGVAPLGLDRSVVGWQMDWAPVMHSGQVDGTVTFVAQNKSFGVHTTTSYHDENWETWLPQTQPFNWLHFTALDSKEKRVDVMMVEFPKNTSRAVGLSLFSEGGSKYWAPGTFSVAARKFGRIPITRHSGPSAGDLVESDVDPAFRGTGHGIPIQFGIETDDDQLSGRMDTVAAVSTATSKPRRKAGPTHEFLIDEQLVRVKIRFLAPNGEVRTAEGPGEFMSTSSDR